MNRAVFLDRDGVINVDAGFVCRFEDFRLIPGVEAALQKLSQTDFKIVIVSNASVVGRGMCMEKDFLVFRDTYMSFLKDKGIRIDRVHHCFHHPEHGIGKYGVDCDCRKPKPGMLASGIKEFDIDAAGSYMVGDKRSDIAAGSAMGCKTILVETGSGGKGGAGCEVTPDFVVKDLQAAVELILGQSNSLSPRGRGLG